MDNDKRIKTFNKKLIFALVFIIAIFGTLLTLKVNGTISTEMFSPMQQSRPNPTYLTYEDLIGYYDILCCQHGQPLKGKNAGILQGSHSGGSFKYDFGKLKSSDVGKVIEKHTIYYQTNDFDKSSYKHFTLGYYKIIKHHIACPKEAYIIAEMKNENGSQEKVLTFDYILDSDGKPIKYTGGLNEAVVGKLTTGETYYTVNQKYVLDTGSGKYYVMPAKDSSGRTYYVYVSGFDGTVKTYNGDFSYTNSKTGVEMQYQGVDVSGVYYRFEGKLTLGGNNMPTSGTLYLVDYDTVVDIDGTLYLADIEGSYRYIQIAWWTTRTGWETYGGLSVSPNSLSKEAEAFEAYILKITKKATIDDLSYAEQKYDFVDDDGVRNTGSVTAPVIDYNPDWNDDADQNNVINEADELTISFDHNNQKYRVGPFSVDYVKEKVHVNGRDPVDFSIIINSTLKVMIAGQEKELELGKDWNFMYVKDQARDDAEGYIFPNPNEVFYIEINYIPDFTEISYFGFDFKYMNAGAELDIYGGTYNTVTWTVKHEDHGHDESDGEGGTTWVFDYREIWLQLTSMVPHNSQTLAHALKGARWYNYTSIHKDFKINKSYVNVEKVTISDETGEKIPVNDIYRFEILVNGKVFEILKVKVRNGYGFATSNKIIWTDEETAPTVEVRELGNVSNNGPWTKTLVDGDTFRVYAENYIKPRKGTLEIDKKLINSTPALENEEFEFRVEITGKFRYRGVDYNRSSANPFIIGKNKDGNVEVEQIKISRNTNWQWLSDEFTWYGSAPHYIVKEIIPEGATYELVDGVISGGNSYLRNSKKPVKAIATNKPTVDWSRLIVDKKLISKTQPEPGEVFYATVTIRGEFGYGENSSIVAQEKTLQIELNQANNWRWESDKILWKNNKIPTYEIHEDLGRMPEGYDFVSITDQSHGTGSNKNELTGNLNSGKTLLIITNDRREKLYGKIHITKLSETEDLVGKEFTFKVKVDGEFIYTENGTKYTDYDRTVKIRVERTSSGSFVGEWTTEGTFEWDKNKQAPRYTVTEVLDGDEGLPAGVEFVSISNGEKTVTSSSTITGNLIGTNDASKAGKVNITCTNKGKGIGAHIVIVKDSLSEELDDFVFHFRVTLTGTFKYYNPDGTYTQYTNETLKLEGSINDVAAVCGGEDWVSELIEWDKNAKAPTYTVEEISIPDYVNFVSLSNREKTVKENFISGTVSEGMERNYITAINEPNTSIPYDGTIRIIKKAQSSTLSGMPFYFDLTATSTSDFTYNNKVYKAGETLEIKDIEVIANSNPWISGKFEWDDGADAPTYTVKENTSKFAEIEQKIKNETGKDVSIAFVSISNDTEISTDASATISGTVNSEKPVRVTAINKDANAIYKGSHIEITKEVLNSELTGINFYFNVEITSRSGFRYYDNENAQNTRQYGPGETLLLEKVCAIADVKDWVSGYIEWDSDNPADIPTYKVTELTGYFPDQVYSVSLRNDTMINAEKLYKDSGRDLTIEGTVTGDITHVIAVNTKDNDYDLYGKVSIQKIADSEIISGEEFTFTLTLSGNFKYGGVEYRNKKLTISDIKVTADGPIWVSDEISWNRNESAPTYTVTEDTASFYDGVEFVSIRNDRQSNTKPTITGTVNGYTDISAIAPNWVIAENTFVSKEPNKGRIKIYKTLVDENGNQIDGRDFTIKLSITKYDSNDNPTTTDREVTVTSGSYWISGWEYWEVNQKTPTYKVEEIDVPEGCTVVIDKPTGELAVYDKDKTDDPLNGVVEVKVKNTIQSHKSKIHIDKDLIVNDKLSKDDVSVSFSFEVTIIGNFTYNKVVYNTDKPLTLKVTVSKENNWQWTSDTIYWYDEAPTYIVEEPQQNIPTSWKLVSIEGGSGELEDGKTSNAKVTNEWYYEEELIVVMQLGGKVWDDTDRSQEKRVDAKENGVIDKGEAGIENVKVTVYRALADRSTGKITQRLNEVFAYDENDLRTRIDAVTYTDSNGNWSINAISVPAFKDESEMAQYPNSVVTYDVEFTYDGQTYEPTTFLSTAGGNANSYYDSQSKNNEYSQVQNKWTQIINASTSERDKYLYDSMAIDSESDRINFNNSFAEITGESAMDEYGNTTGLAIGTDGNRKELKYSSVDSVSLFNSDNTRKVSTLETKNSDGEIEPQYAINASTSNANLTFPFYTADPAYDDTAWHLMSWDKTLTDHFEIKYKFEAIYNYCLSINLGLIEREATDVSVEKDLTTATVVVNGKVLKYKFNTAIDLSNPDNFELLYKQIAVQDAKIEYRLGLYKSDYYYRASVYGGSDAGNAMDTYIKTLGISEGINSTEMEIYLEYTIIVHNESETYDVEINSLADYYDNSFSLVTQPQSKYVHTVNGKTVEEVVELAKPSTVTLPDGSSLNVNWQEKDNHSGSDGVTYVRLVTDTIKDRKLASGETATFKVTFSVDKIEQSGIKNAIMLGAKHNVVEIANFTSYYSSQSKNKWSTPGQITGRVDEDSAPNNINMQYNEKTYYEDDTDAAPIITIDFNDEDRAVTGLAWDDAQTDASGYGQIVGNGIYNPDEGDKIIPGLTTEIYETISVPTSEKYTDSNGVQHTVYDEFEFAWPTNEPNADLGGKTIKELTGFDQAIVTDAYGEYTFVAVPAGNYKVRFVYGDKSVETGNNGKEEVYSGADYKTTAYQSGFDNDSNNDGYIDNEWHDLSNNQLEATRVSDTRDDEERRLYITSKSEMLTYDNTHVLAYADNKAIVADNNSDEAKALFGNYKDSSNNPVKGDGYYMYSETAKLNLGVENIYKISYITEKIGNVEVGLIEGDKTQAGKQVGTRDFTYIVKNVDCGIEERSQTKLTLDKQIKEITLTSSDGKVILDAIYDINYTLGTDGSIKSVVAINESASTGINNIASLNRNGKSTQGYRYLIADSTILQGTTLTVRYQLSVFNMSETDRCSTLLEALWKEYNSKTTQPERDAVLNNALNKVSSIKYAEDIGRVYKDGSGFAKAEYGTYMGAVYYLGKQGVGVRPDETIVKTEVHQMVDYVDPDVVFTDLNNVSRDQSWTNTQIQTLLDDKLIDPSVVQIVDADGNITGSTAADRGLNTGERYSIISDNYQEYAIGERNNIITNIDNNADETNATNPSLVKFLEPYMANRNDKAATATISLEVSRYYSSELDSNDIDNIAEIIKAENTVGRRDIRAIAGNANPFEIENPADPDDEPIGVYQVAAKEPDTSATEVITLSPPTGLDAHEVRIAKLVLVTLFATIIIAVGIVLIKKKVLMKK